MQELGSFDARFFGLQKSREAPRGSSTIEALPAGFESFHNCTPTNPCFNHDHGNPLQIGLSTVESLPCTIIAYLALKVKYAIAGPKPSAT